MLIWIAANLLVHDGGLEATPVFLFRSLPYFPSGKLFRLYRVILPNTILHSESNTEHPASTTNPISKFRSQVAAE